jgi:hypothetical protein
MTLRQIATSIVFCLALTPLSIAADDEQTPPEEISRWIHQLDAEDFVDREAASAALVAIGEEALVPLEKVLADSNASAEMRQRAAEAVKLLRFELIKKEGVKIAEIIDLAKKANRGDGDNERLEALLRHLTDILAVDTGMNVPVPVKLAEVRELNTDATVTSIQNALVVTDVAYFSTVKNSIVLAESAVEISSAQNSIIIAGAAASVTSPRNSVVIAGQDIYTSSCRDSLILSGGQLRMSSLYSGVVGAVEPLTFTSLRGGAIVNSPPLQAVLVSAAKQVESEAVTLTLDAPEDSLGEKLILTMVVASRTDPIAIFRRQEGKGEYVARAGEPLTFPHSGEAIPELEGWKLVYCGRRGYAIFDKDGEQALVRVAESSP